MLNDFVPARLAKNAKLHRELSNERPYSLVESGGRYHVQRSLPFQHEKLEQLFAFVARGLAYHHWDQVIPADASVYAGSIHPDVEPGFECLLAMNGRRVVEVIGNSVFEYEGVQSAQDPWVTIWRFKIYGGATFADQEAAPGHPISTIWATTSRANLGAIIRGETEEAADLAAAP